MTNQIAPNVCPKCGSEVKYIPEGVSKKTGKRYSEFWACKSLGCDYSWNKPAEFKKPDYPSPEPTSKDEALTVLRDIYLKLDDILTQLKNDN